MNEEYKKLQIEGSDWSYGSRWGDQMEEAIIKFGQSIADKNSRLLDIGCGEGRGLDALVKLDFKQVFGVDISPDKIAKARSKGYLIYEYDFHKLTELPLLAKSFDYTFCSHTLEHAYDIELALKSIEFVTKKQLHFIVPVGETKEEVNKYNPSHTHPFASIFEIDELLKKLKYNFSITEQTRLCKEVHGIIYYEE